MTVPDDLRNVLEQCLAEDATAENLELYLPTVRQIITNLLQGLRGKQSIYRRIVNEHRRGSDQSGTTHDRIESRSSRGERASRRGEGGHRSQLSRTIAENERPERDSVSQRSGQSTSRRRDPTSNGDEQFVGGFAPPLPEQSPPSSNQTFSEDNTPTFPEPQARKSRQIPSSSIPSTPESAQLTHPEPPPTIPAETTPKPLPPPAVPASVKRYSLVDKPVLPPAVVVEPSSPSMDQYSTPSSPAPETPPSELPPAMANSLAALKKNDVLERRASKRFSTFNISKMTGGPTIRERSVRGHPNRRSLAVSNTLTPGELAVLTEVDDEEPAAGPTLRREGSARARSISRTATPERRQNTPPVPPLPPAKTPEPLAIDGPSQHIASENKPIETPADPSRITVFLQLGREVKKATIEPNLSFSTLRVLFVDKFSYNPGKENFPAIYIRDPSSGVQYELEDTDEVKEKCLLSLNIEREHVIFHSMQDADSLCSLGPNKTAHRRPNLDTIK
jgi:hypothetical protein